MSNCGKTFANRRRSFRTKRAGVSEGAPAWLHAFASEQQTVYVVDPTRSGRPAEQLLGSDWSGTLVHDGWSVYDNFTSPRISNAWITCSAGAKGCWKRRRPSRRNSHDRCSI